MTSSTPLFSIVVPTCDRPVVLARALRSIVDQSCTDYEVIVVDDSLRGVDDPAMVELKREFSDRFFFHHRSGEDRHHAAIARNEGARRARGAYIGFLDDDDYWCDQRHLEIARQCLEAHPATDVFIVNQVAQLGEETVIPSWLPYVDRVIARRPKMGDTDCHKLELGDLLQPEGIGFAHVNMSIVRRKLFDAIGGFWDEVPNEEDLDFFLRVISVADSIVYRPATASVHTIRTTGRPSWNTDEKNQKKRALTCEHAAEHCGQPAVRQYANRLQASALRTMARFYFEVGDFRQASDVAARAVAVDPSVKWTLIAAALKLRSTVSPSERP